MTAISGLIIKSLRAHGKLDNDQIEIIKYGLNQLFILILDLSALIVIGLILDNLFYMITFTGVYLFIQRFSGGYHASTQWMCFIYSTLMLYVNALFLVHYNIKSGLLLLLITMCSAIILFLGPVDTKNRRFDYIEKRVFTKRLRTAVPITSSIIIFVVVAGAKELAEYMAFALLMSTLMVMVGKLSNFIYIRRTTLNTSEY